MAGWLADWELRQPLSQSAIQQGARKYASPSLIVLSQWITIFHFQSHPLHYQKALHLVGVHSEKYFCMQILSSVAYDPSGLQLSVELFDNVMDVIRSEKL